MTDISQSDWSEADASNNSTPPDGWPSSTMLPTQVEPAARAIRGAIKRFWDRIQGVYASTGSANAYVLTPTAALGAYVTGERYSFRSNFANTGAATLNISGLGAKTIKKMTSSGKADLVSGDIQSGQPVTVEYDGTDLIVTTALAAMPIQQVFTETGAVATGTTQTPADDTIPQNTEGDQYMSLAITPKSATSTLVIEVVFCGSNSSGANGLTAAIFQDTTANALAAAIANLPGANAAIIMSFRHSMTSGTTSATTFKLRVGCNIAGTTTFNGVAGGRLLGGVMASSMRITEILP